MEWNSPCCNDLSVDCIGNESLPKISTFEAHKRLRQHVAHMLAAFIPDLPSDWLWDSCPKQLSKCMNNITLCNDVCMPEYPTI